MPDSADLTQSLLGSILDPDGPNFSPNQDVRYSLGLEERGTTAILVARNENDSAA